MPDDRSRPFSWTEQLPWLRLGRSLRASLSIRVLLAAMIGYVGTKAGWRVIGKLFEGTDNLVLKAHIEAVKPWPWESDTLAATLPRTDGWLSELVQGPLVSAWTELTHPFYVMFDHQVGWTGLAYAILCGLWLIAVWSFFGSIITRTAAMRFARNETPTLGHCIRFTNKWYFSYFIAPLFPLLGIILAAIPLVLLGLISRLDFGALLVGIFGFVVLLCGLFMAILSVALAAGWPLMWATISSEGTDAFDALSRMYAYVYQRPVKLLFYLIIAAILGTIGVLFVGLLGTSVAQLGGWGLSLGTGPSRLATLVDSFATVVFPGTTEEELSGMGKAGSNLLEFWFGLIYTVMKSYPIAFLWCAYTGIYFLLRYDVDAAEMDEVYLDQQQQSYGLPHLATDSAGVPLATDAPPTQSAEPTETPQNATKDDNESPPSEESNGDGGTKE